MTSAGRPCVVMAHGLGGTKDSGLAPFAEALAAAGLDVLAFDYRGFGASAGQPRQTVSMVAQLEDYRAALTAAAALPGVDAQRLVLWGVSLAGGHVFAAGAGRDDIAAIVAADPAGRRARGRSARAGAPHARASCCARPRRGSGARCRLAAVVARSTMPVVGRPGDVAALTLDGCYDDYLAIAGPTWRNEVDASVGLELGNHRPGKRARSVRSPMLVQIADFDRSAPPHAAAKAAFKARAEVRHYPCDHFDVYAGKRWHASVVAHQVHFLQRHLGRVATS